MISKNQIDQVYDFLKSINDGTLESYRKSLPEQWILNQVIDVACLTPSQRIVCLYFAGDETQCGNALEKRLVLNKEQCGQCNLRQLVDEWSTSTQLINNQPQSMRAIIQCSSLRNALEHILTTFSIDYLRPVPTIIQSSFNWISLHVADPFWDYTIEVSQEPLVRIKENLLKAQQCKLSQKEAQETIDLLNQDQRHVLDSGITPNQLPNLIEYNPDLSSFLLARINQCGISIHEYFECLIQMKISLQSLEVVNKLSNSIKLPEAFLHMYLTKCIQYCEELQPKQQLVSRYVRLVAVFIKTLIKSKTLDPKRMFTEIQGFCIEFSKIPEASLLFKQLKETGVEEKQHQ
ncbi:unnamed protein product [Paramecium pentaurelia]|uniref:CCR4-NOT transcription complex subunit 11 n=1 Tax=Paramecium pentaurelia TaxID=43138 RepID=A0A8S1XT08_9CILI|nr:unnamed protein product [Paramecium pentaurelia]